ncbi:GNAT family N-acetyltransferase [Halosimplex aquaticum]
MTELFGRYGTRRGDPRRRRDARRVLVRAGDGDGIVRRTERSRLRRGRKRRIRIRAPAERDDATVYLLVAEETEVGYLLLREDEHPSRVHSAYADIVDLFVAPEHRGQGYGSEALDAVKQIASDRGAEYVTVSCEWHNDGARRFYEDNGFTEKQVTYAQRLD